jgi:hypothetical protein
MCRGASRSRRPDDQRAADGGARRCASGALAVLAAETLDWMGERARMIEGGVEA